MRLEDKVAVVTGAQMAGRLPAALFLASDEADMITGLCMEVDGGRCI